MLHFGAIFFSKTARMFLVFPTSVFGVGVCFWLRLFLIIAYLYLSVVVPFVLCFGVELLCCLNRMYVFIFLFKFE